MNGINLEMKIKSSCFGDMLYLAEHFWDFPQETRLRILCDTTVDPFLIHGNFSRFFCAFGFRDYFAPILSAEYNSSEERAAVVKARFEELLLKMQRELLEIITYEPPTGRRTKEASFIQNVCSYAFCSPMCCAGMEDYDQVARSVHALAMSRKYPDAAQHGFEFNLLGKQ